MVIELTPAERKLDLEKALRDVEELSAHPDMPLAALLALGVCRATTRVALWLREALLASADGQRVQNEEIERLGERLSQQIHRANCLGEFARACQEQAKSLQEKHDKVLAALTEALEGKWGWQEQAEALEEKCDKLLDDLNFIKGERDKLVSEIENGSYCSDTPFDDALNDMSYYHFERLESLTEEPSKDDPFRHVALAEKHGLGLDAFPIFAVEETLRSDDMGSYESWRKIAHAALLAMSYLRPRFYEAEESLAAAEDADCEDLENECERDNSDEIWKAIAEAKVAEAS